MCGITGLWGGSTRFHSSGEASRVLREMRDSLAHRGPDAEGVYEDRDQRLVIGHRRLSIQDVSSAGGQPMESKNGRYVVSYNGEIYNHLELRAELGNGDDEIRWRGLSDTETLLKGIEIWGLLPTLEKIVGMFALALWDRKTQEISLARDRFGEKPLYYSWQDDAFIFASEIKALEIYPCFDKEINQAAVHTFLAHKFIPAPLSIWKNVYKLKPATCLTIKAGTRTTKEVLYWNSHEKFLNGIINPVSSNLADIQSEVESLIRNSVKGQMISDVSIGAFLSGGIDSSLVTMMMQEESESKINTYSIGVGDGQFNEAVAASNIARILGTKHTEFQVKSDDVLAVIPEIQSIYDEPFADSSQLVTYLISKLAKNEVTVALTGDGGDEVFCGYNRYVFASKYWKKISKFPVSTRAIIGRSLQAIPRQFWLSVLDVLDRNGRLSSNHIRIPEKISKIAKALEQKDRQSLYRSFVSDTSGRLNPNNTQVHQFDLESICDREDVPIVDYMMYLDSQFYLPGDILTKTDRASMAVSLETRTPFLDHRLVEYSWSIRSEDKMTNGKSKSILRSILYEKFGREAIDRPKMGFAVPMKEWLSGPLKSLADKNLSQRSIQKSGLVDFDATNRIWQEHQKGKQDHHALLWSLISLQGWHASRFNGISEY